MPVVDEISLNSGADRDSAPAAALPMIRVIGALSERSGDRMMQSPTPLPQDTPFDYWSAAQHMTFWQWLGGRVVLTLVLVIATLLSAAIIVGRPSRPEK
jgi:hypothetical protein